ncbi:MAG: hypothetical protein KGH83_07235 [Thaumarchaeota archaeon]|nr:hypothetical protein [Nitrososphaerota archaeon]
MGTILPDRSSIASNANFTGISDDERSMLAAMKADLPLIMLGTMAFHILYGVIMYIYSSMFLSEKYKTQKKLDLIGRHENFLPAQDYVVHLTEELDRLVIIHDRGCYNLLAVLHPPF